MWSKYDSALVFAVKFPHDDNINIQVLPVDRI